MRYGEAELRPAASTIPDRPRLHKAGEHLTSHVTRATPIIHANATPPEAVWREPDHTHMDNMNPDRGTLEAASFVKPLAGGHSSGAPALPYGIGVSGVPNHAEHTTSQRAHPKIPIDPSCAHSPSANLSSIRHGATSKARQRANRPEEGKKAREERTWRGRAEIALPPGS